MLIFLHHIAAALDQQQHEFVDIEEARQWLREYASHKKALFIFDDVCDSIPASQLNFVDFASSASHVLLTTRSHDVSAQWNATEIAMPLPSLHFAAALLCKYAHFTVCAHL